MSDSSLGNAPVAPQDFNDTPPWSDSGPAESAAQAAAIMGITNTENASDATVSAHEAGASNNTPPTSADSSPSLSSLAAPIVDQAKQQAQKVVEHTQRAAGEAVGQARDKTKTWIETQLDEAAGSLDNIAGAVRETGQQLRSHDPNNLGQIADLAINAADSVHDVSARLRDATTDEIIVETERFARRQPGLFLGGVFALGFVLARFLKSSNSSGGAGNTNLAPASNDRLLPVPLDQEPQAGRVDAP